MGVKSRGHVHVCVPMPTGASLGSSRPPPGLHKRTAHASTQPKASSSARSRPRAPAVVLHRQLEVGERDGDERGDEDEDDVDNEQDGPDDVNLVAPHAGKDVVQLGL